MLNEGEIKMEIRVIEMAKKVLKMNTITKDTDITIGQVREIAIKVECNMFEVMDILSKI